MKEGNTVSMSTGTRTKKMYDACRIYTSENCLMLNNDEVQDSAESTVRLKAEVFMRTPRKKSERNVVKTFLPLI